jgi:hypothetical protein
MRRVIVDEFVSLDGVAQAPGGAEDDPSGGFRHGGWHMQFMEDEVALVALGQSLEADPAPHAEPVPGPGPLRFPRGRCHPRERGSHIACGTLPCLARAAAAFRGYRCCSIKRLPSACARFAASRSPSAACTIEPFIRMCQERAKASGSRSPASSARLRRTARMFSR